MAQTAAPGKQRVPLRTEDVGAELLDILSRGQDTPELRRATDNLNRFLQVGGQVAYGTDLGNEGTAPGIDGEELALLARAGFSPREVIDAATAAAAALIGEQHLGHLRRGDAASVIGVDEGALKDVRLLAKPSLVLIDGAPPEAVLR